MSKNNTTKIITAGTIGNILEWYDFGLYAFFAPIIAKLYFPSNDPVISIISTFGVFASGFLFRPLGAVIFGNIGDKYGRKKALTLSVILMAFPTAMIGLLPTYSQIGIFAPILLTIIRILQGISVGGEFTGSITFCVELAPEGKRGFFGSLSTMGTNIGTLLGSGIGALISTSLSTEALISWGWRIPFILGISIGFVGLIMRRKLPESMMINHKNSEEQKSPIKETLVNNWNLVLKNITATIIYATGFYMTFIYLSTFFTEQTHIQLSKALEINTISMVVLVVLIPVMGFLSDKFGRKLLLLVGTGGLAVTAYPVFLILSNGTVDDDMIGQCIFSLFLSMIIGTFPSMMVEFFPSKIRMTAMSVSFNAAMALFGGSAPIVASYMISVTKSLTTPAFYLIVCAIISFLMILSFKETFKEPLK